MDTATADWTRAACATGDARLLRLFFSEDAAETAEAKAICATCPLRLTCLEGALARAEPWGVWGGHLFEKGRVIDQKRSRGRPRKEDAERRRRFEEQVARELDVAGEVA